MSRALEAITLRIPNSRRNSSHGTPPHNLHIDLRALEVLPAVDEPLDRGDKDDDGEGDDAVVWQDRRCTASDCKTLGGGLITDFARKENVDEDVLMLLPVTGSSGGKRKNIVVTMTYAIPSCHTLSYRYEADT